MPRSLTTHIDSPVKVGRRLKEARLRAGISQRKLAFAGCTAAYVSRIEAGTRVPSLQMINELAARLDVSAEWLATGISPIFAYGTSRYVVNDDVNLHLLVEVFGDDERLAVRAMQDSKFRLESALIGSEVEGLVTWVNRFSAVPGKGFKTTSARFEIGSWRLVLTGSLRARNGLPVEDASVIVASVVEHAGRQLFKQLSDNLLADAEARMFTILDRVDPEAQAREIEAELATF